MNKSEAENLIPAEDLSAFRAAVREGIAEADAGRLVPFAPIAEWLASWGIEDEAPLPE